MIPLLHTPEGVRDIYGNEKIEMNMITEQIVSCMKTYGYEEIQTPSFEYFDVFSSERGTVPSKDIYKFIDRDGNTLVLRPDMTPSIARCAATYFKQNATPVRLCYQGNTFINNSGYQLRLKEITQAGAELFGDDSVLADADMIAMTVECLKKSGLKEFQIEVGDAGIFRAIANECKLTEEEEEELRIRIKNKNLFGISDMLKNKEIDENARELLLTLPELFGSEDVLDRAKSLTDNEKACVAIDRLKKMYSYLKEFGVEKYVSFDLGMLSKYRYYTGIIFRAITYGTGEAIASGGRYDTLVEQFGEHMAAIGMSVIIDNLMLALERQNLLPHHDQSKMLVVYKEEAADNAIAFAKQKRAEGNAVSLMAMPDDWSKEDEIKLSEREEVTIWNILQ